MAAGESLMQLMLSSLTDARADKNAAQTRLKKWLFEA
jgi:hypothetical protein